VRKTNPDPIPELVEFRIDGGGVFDHVEKRAHERTVNQRRELGGRDRPTGHHLGPLFERSQASGSRNVFLRSFCSYYRIFDQDLMGILDRTGTFRRNSRISATIIEVKLIGIRILPLVLMECIPKVN
jgi:hypothetical protein